ncbi:hypothetical protein ACH4RA_03680 [Streptomyces smyrnaeus]|uniref:hypothetical protein n=1 Tax=Streptomyces TaxID=1883 RepID=UPI000C189B98|nr:MULTISPECIES: hypothetical protein [unclassified Streptomyces]MBQ0863541.1 hypothetical protein [Streptomyces sp. RK75]MBQ1122123.1 hypothetical protein [Streptomyces sp. B15]
MEEGNPGLDRQGAGVGCGRVPGSVEEGSDQVAEVRDIMTGGAERGGPNGGDLPDPPTGDRGEAQPTT